MRDSRAIPVGFREVEGTLNQWNKWLFESFTYVLLRYLGYPALSIPFDDSSNRWTVQWFLTEWICMTVAENITKLVLEDKRLWQTMLATYGAFRQVDDQAKWHRVAISKIIQSTGRHATLYPLPQW